MVYIKPYKGNQIQLVADDPSLLNLIRDHFSIPNPAYRGSMTWLPKRIYAITPTFRAEIGLVPEISKFLHQYPIQCRVDPLVTSQLYPRKYLFGDSDSADIPYKELKGLDRTFRDYQDAAIRTAINKGRGICRVATSGGKTLIMAGLILNQCPKKTVVIVPNTQLVEQTAKDFKEYGLNGVSKWSGTNPLQADSSIIICNTQILLSKNTDLTFLEQFDLVLIDECHQLGVRSNENNKIFKYIATYNIFGFTGTLPPSKINEWNIIGKIGPVFFEEGVKSLLAKGHITNFSITVLELEHKCPPKFIIDVTKPTKAYIEEQEHLMKLERRNDIIAKLAIQLKSNTLIMVDRLFYGELLEAVLKGKTQQPIYFIQGVMEMDDREKIRALMDTQSDVIVIAMSKIFSTGINIPNLSNIIFSSAGKSFVRIIQSIGRSLRLHPTKTKANIFDICDNLRYSKKHADERLKIYEKEDYPYKTKKIQI